MKPVLNQFKTIILMLDDHPSCAFAQLLPDNPPEEFVSTPFGCTPKGSILSYQALEYKHMAAQKRPVRNFQLCQ